MSGLKGLKDANGHPLVMMYQRGLRLCEVCNLVMSEGYMVDDGGGYACSDACLIKAEWVIENPETMGEITATPAVLATWARDVSPYEDPDDDEIEESPECPVFWTNWEGDEPMPEEVGDRLLLEPYNLTTDDLHELGAHEDDADLSCEACSRG